MAQSNFFDFGTIIDLATGVANHVKPKEGEEKGFEINYQQIALLVAGIAGRRAFGWVLERRENRKNELEEAQDILRKRAKLPAKRKKKKGNTIPFVAGGSVAGAAVYLLTMKPEQRAVLFQNIDHLIDQISGFYNEFRGKPYSQDYEVKRGV